MDNLTMRNNAIKDAMANKITPIEYWNILKKTWAGMSAKEKRGEGVSLRIAMKRDVS